MCPGLSELQMESDSSRAADTGSMAGRIIELAHRLGDAVEATKQANLELASYPLSDALAATRAAARYIEDTRTWDGTYGLVLPELCEAEVRCEIDGIELVGHVDQIRDSDTWRVWDVKNTGRYEGTDALHAYAWQLAGYAVAASETFGRTVLPGGIILLQGYFGQRKSKKPASECGGVWIQANWSLDQCREMLGHAVAQIKRVQAGDVACIPGPHCGFCPAGGPNVCASALRDLYDEEVF